MKNIIRIDDEVRDKLEEKALEFEMNEEPPNAILRKILGLEHKKAYSWVNNRHKRGNSMVKNRTERPRRAVGRPATR